MAQYRSSLLDKIRGTTRTEQELQEEEEARKRLINTDTTPKIAAWYHANDAKAQQPKTSVFRSESPINKSVHQRMKDFVKSTYKKP